jgi:transcriptional regulator with XRE-family HTH domain
MGLTFEQQLAAVFGCESVGATAEERAATSSRIFVRSQDHLAFASNGATGRLMTAQEALDAFGPEKLLEIVDYGSAILPRDLSEPARTLKAARTTLGLTQDDAATRSGVHVDTLRRAENSERRTPIQDLQKIAMALGLDERLIAFSPGAGADHQLGARLKQLGAGGVGFSTALVATFAEAAWVIRTEARLRAVLGWKPQILTRFRPDSHYGSAAFPTWEHGFSLAVRARDILNLPQSATIRPLRTLIFRLGIPLINATLPEKVAGATLSSGGVRGILVNTAGQNANVWVRRSTMAHELGHLLWDPEHKLKSVRVDKYADIGSADATNDHVEGRANAFAVEFLAPRRELEKMYRTSATSEDGLRAVMERFGISFTAARFHVWNACDRAFSWQSLHTPDWSPPDDWRAEESFSDDWFPIPETSQARRGAFAACVVAARRGGMIHEDTAALYLQTDVAAYREAEVAIEDMFSDLLATPAL